MRTTTKNKLIPDYDRLHFAPKEVQLRHFPPLLALSKTFRLPLFLHSRSSEAHVDFVKILKEAGWDDTWPGGVVHSFTGTIQEAKELVCRCIYTTNRPADERWIWDYISG
jgi:TatD DNase family protein